MRTLCIGCVFRLGRGLGRNDRLAQRFLLFFELHTLGLRPHLGRLRGAGFSFRMPGQSCAFEEWTETFDKYHSAEISLPRIGPAKTAKVRGVAPSGQEFVSAN